MADRSAIKARAREMMKTQYRCAVLASLLTALLNGLHLNQTVRFSASLGVELSVGNALALFVGSVVVVGACHVFMKISRAEATSVNEMFSRAFANYGRNLGGMLWMQLWVLLWSLALVIPGVYKSLRYSCAPYILAECPEVRATEALNLSKRITRGHAGEILMFYLSFAGWFVLSALTAGLLLVFYAGPYFDTARAALCDTLVQSALAEGVIAPEELGAAAAEQ